jgi:hypothetical protein
MATSNEIKKQALEQADLEAQIRIRDLETSKSIAVTRKEILKLEIQISKERLAQQKLVAQIQKLEEDSIKYNESVVDSLNDQIRSLNTKKTINKKLLSAEAQQLNLTERIQQRLAAGVISHEKAAKLLKTLNKLSSDKLQLEKAILDSKKASLDIDLKKKQAQMDAASEYVKGIESNMRKIPVIGDLLANTLMGPRAQRNLTAKFYKYFKNPKLTKLMQGKGLGVGVMTAGIALTSASIKATLAREQELKDQQRSIGLTNEQTKAVDRMQRRLLMNSSSMVVSLEEARKASAELVEDFGTFGAENEILVDQQVKLTKAFGLTGEEASNFQRTSTIIGRTTEDSKLAVFATAAGFNKLTGSTQSLSGILRTVSRLSDSIRIQFRGSDEELTNAVMKAKALGTSLEDLNGIADQLLNIESSIENQVTAQLVTGRNINLDRARFFALTDNMNGLMDELVKQEIDYASYSKMNRVEKQATAAALGMNVDQMSKFVSQQELATQLGIDMSKAENQTSAGLAESLKMHQATIEARAKLGDAAAKQYMRDNEALTTQEKMTAAVEQMATVFKVLGPILAGLGVIITAIGAALAYAAISAAAIAIAASGGALVPWILGGIAAVAVGLRIYKGMASGGEVVGGSGPVVVGENGPEIVRLKKGNSVTPNSQLNTVGNNNKETNDLLRQILAKVDQPAIIKMGDTTINELGNKINLNRNYSAS